MDNGYIRAAVALIFAALLWAQTRGATGQRWRRHAFELAAGALLALAGYNALAAANTTPSTLQPVLLVVSGLLFAGAAIALLQAWRNSELRAGRTTFEETMRNEGARRSKAAHDHSHKREP